MSGESIKFFPTSENSLAFSLNYIGVIPRKKFDGQYLKQDKVTFTPKNAVNIYIVYEINLWAYIQGFDFIFGNFLFRSVELTENNDFEKYKYSVDGIGFGARKTFSLSDCSGFGKNVIIFGADMSSSVHVDNRKKDVFILGKGLTQELNNTTLTAGKEYPINFSEKQKKFCLKLNYNRVTTYIFLNSVEIYKFKPKDSKINPVPLCLDNNSKDVLVADKKKTGL